MRIIGSFDAFKKVWPPAANALSPVLYTMTPQGRLDKIYPIHSDAYEWVLDAMPVITEDDFLATYGYAVKVSLITP